MRVNPVVLTALLAGCYDQPFASHACDYELQSAETSAILRDSAGKSLGTLEVGLGEMRSDSFSAALSIAIRGAQGSGGGPLKGHVRQARLILGGGQPLVIELPTGWPFMLQTRDDIIVPDRVTLSGAEEASIVRAAFLSGHAVVDLETDVPRVGFMRVPLQLKGHSDWERPSCGGST